jgi:hypothetical protein
LLRVPAAYFNSTFQSFLEIGLKRKKNVLPPPYYSPFYYQGEYISGLTASDREPQPIASPSQPQKNNLIVRDCVYDEILQYGIFACSDLYNESFFSSTKPHIVKGILKIYKMSFTSSAAANKKIGDENRKNMTFNLLTSKDFSESISHIAWDRKRRAIFLELKHVIATYFLSNNGKELIYVAETTYHDHRLMYLAVDPYKQDYYIAASRRGKFTCFDLNQGIVTQQLENSTEKHEMSTFTFNFESKIGYFGTTKGMVLIYDCNKNTPTKIRTFIIPHNGDKKLENKGRVNCLLYLEERKSILGCHWNRIFIYQPTNLSAPLSDGYEFIICLDLFPKVTINFLSSFQNNNFISVFTSSSNLLVLEFLKPKATANQQPQKPQLPVPGGQGVVGKSTVPNKDFVATQIAMTSASKVNHTHDSAYLTITASNILDWKEVIHRDNTTLRDWLRARGVDYSEATTRMGLLLLVTKSEKKDISELVIELRKKPLSKVPLFVQKLYHPDYLKNGQVLNKKIPFIHCCTIIDELQLMLLGGQNGFLYYYSLDQMFPSFSGLDEQFMEFQRNLSHKANIKEVKGSTTTTKAKRLEAMKK